MVVAEYDNLAPVKVLINNSAVHLELFEGNEGHLFLSSSACKPEGLVYYATTPTLFCKFLEGLITLQTLFNESPSLFVEIKNKGNTILYSRKDIEVQLICGGKTIKELIDHCPIEVW